MSKGARQRADDFHPETLPKFHRRFVGRDDEIELHRPEPEMTRFLQAMLAHRATDPLPTRTCRDYERRIRDMRAAAGLVRMQRIASDDLYYALSRA